MDTPRKLGSAILNSESDLNFMESFKHQQRIVWMKVKRMSEEEDCDDDESDECDECGDEEE